MDISFETIKHFIETQIPHVQEIGAQLLEVSHNGMRIRVPFQEKFIANVADGVVHGGLITIMLDTVCGSCVYLETKLFEPIVTLDLRIDYLQASVPNKDFIAQAICYAVTKNIAFCRGTVYQDGGKPIAHAVATFMRGTAGPAPSYQSKAADPGAGEIHGAS